MDREDPYSPQAMMAEFHSLKNRIGIVESISGPLREDRDAFVNAAREKELAMNAKIRSAEEGLYDMKRRLAILARALGNNVGIEAKPANIGVDG
jgi:hypothetical protein